MKAIFTAIFYGKFDSLFYFAKVKVYKSIEEFQNTENAVVTTGTFDGVHLGHQHILKKLRELAKSNNGESVILTFFPHPRIVLNNDTDLKLINTIEEKIELIKEAGIQHLIIHPFTKEFSRTTSLEFVRNILVNKIGTKKLVIGYDHHFGRNREGSFEHLVEYGPTYGFEVEEISAHEVENVNVSSTKIRRALAEGNVEIAKEYLGRFFSVEGIVVKGNQNGRTLGFPTANIDIQNNHKLIPANGVYAVKVIAGNKNLSGMLNIGTRPTIDASEEKSIEVNIFDFKEDIYGKKLKIYFVSRLRDEKKFENLELLKAEMKKDKVRSINILR